jgi:hypothetical protein|tara:strand:- start:478 stop:882 length:405 start_codon:yes stop_codon:yes gene_type:complete
MWKFDISSLSPLLITGDILILMAFMILGQLSHDMIPWKRPDRYLMGILPFFIGWLIAAPIIGAYSYDSLSSPINAAKYAAIAWFFADLLAMLIRGLPFMPGGVAISFFLVSYFIGAIMLVSWRVGLVGFGLINT